MKITGYGRTDVGRKRKGNEDAFAVDNNLGMFIVCDGVGGHAAGEVASATTVAVVQEVIGLNRTAIQNYLDDPTVANRTQVLQLVEYAVQEACAQVFDLSEKEQAKKGMGTTIVLMLTLGDAAVIAHVGDSRAYVVREDQAHQLTEDHSLVWEQIKAGRLTKEEAEKSPYANVITRCVGHQKSVQVDTLFVELQEGDQFLLCSDGFHGYLKGDDELASLCARYTPDRLPEVLINLANERGGKDNITAIVVQAGDPKAAATAAAEEQRVSVARKVEALKHIPLFKHCNYQELVKVLNIVTVRAYRAGQTIIEEDSTGDEFYIILVGKVQVLKNGQFLTALQRGAHFGEMGLIDRAPRSATIKAEDNTKLMVIDRKDFYPLLKNEPQMAVKLLWSFLQVLNDRLRATNAELTEVKGELKAVKGEQNFLFGGGEPGAGD